MSNCNKIVFLLLKIIAIFGNSIASQKDGTSGTTKSLSYCSHPAEADNVETEWFKKHGNLDWKIQVSNTVMRDHIVKYIKEMDVTAETDFTGMCPRDIFHYIDDTHITGIFGGFGNQHSHWNCSHTDGTIGINDCEFFSINDVFKETGKLYLSLFEHKEGHAMTCYVICFKNGEVGWYASTLAQEFTDKDVEKVLKHFKSLGFNTEDHHRFPSSECTY